MGLTEPFGRIDTDPELRKKLLRYCRLQTGDVWVDPVFGHKVSVGDATKSADVCNLFSQNEKASLAIQDPPYNIIVGNENTDHLFKKDIQSYLDFSKLWVKNTIDLLSHNSSLYIWLGADQKEHFQPLPDFMIMMRSFSGVKSRSFITMRNQRGYGTQHNWMAVRQECLYYTIGNPVFNIDAEYTDIPKVLKGYYKEVNGKITDNEQRSKSNTIRAGNVWLDIQQVFYRLQENVPGCYAQKPLSSIERIIKASSNVNDIIVDFFSHSGTTLIASEKLKRKAYVMDLDPIFVELSIRRLEKYRKTGKIGFQCENPFYELSNNDYILNQQDDNKEYQTDEQQLISL